MTIHKSGIIPWKYENINLSPKRSGVFILRTNDYSVFKVGTANTNLQKTLQNNFKNNNSQDIKFFDWYSIENKDDLVEVSSELKEKYNF